MEVHLGPQTEKKLKELAEQTGRTADELAEDAIAIYAGELAHVRDALDRRYDDVRSGRVKLIPGDEAFASLTAKTEADRKKRST